ncbi:hypothetical protein [Actinoplanes derwentensis]|uniref:Uncharacterized protein n=1 Tax=Actinoplanes derwentensis TaxID=113562 RepID=A0A1H2DE95_9ACTN|nr:hypothetical protein [Actinoplanes derwentensis]GID84863.1 hypothetical protein Ade03nite_37870 [Actinoplanes derwentensis]SDT80917.1 hypothetical protein SAMN04489716_9418 [Actinoplanes derwentensis]
MDELDRLLAETMHDAAVHAPSDTGLLGTVHDRSRRYRRRRVATVAAVATAAVLVAAVPVVTVLAARPDPVAPPAAPVPATSGSTSVPSSPEVTAPVVPPSPSVPSSPSSSRRSSSGTATSQVKLTSGWTAPVFPYTLPATDGMSAPIGSADGGRLSAFFEATELREHSDVTVTVSSGEPSFTAEATETSIRVRGHAGTLRTVDVQPAKQLTLVWKESSSRWIRLDTDDTYTPSQVVALADSLTGASIPVQPPFDLARSPAGLVTDTVSASRMTFRASGTSTAGFRTVLRKRQQLTGADRRVGGYDAVLTRRTGSVTLAVDVTDWDATLEVTVADGLTISDADLLSYAEGVRILNRSNPE